MEVPCWTSDMTRYEEHLTTAVNMGMCYVYSSGEVQAEVAILTMIVLHVDDFDIPPTAVDEYLAQTLTMGHTNVSSQQADPHPIFTSLTRHLQRMAGHLLPFAARSYILSVLNYLSCTVFLEQDGKSPYAPRVGDSDAMLRYAEYLRRKTGLGEGYALCIWNKDLFPDAQTYICAIP